MPRGRERWGLRGGSCAWAPRVAVGNSAPVEPITLIKAETVEAITMAGLIDHDASDVQSALIGHGAALG